jgi:hypothetical protein
VESVNSANLLLHRAADANETMVKLTAALKE